MVYAVNFQELVLILKDLGEVGEGGWELISYKMLLIQHAVYNNYLLNTLSMEILSLRFTVAGVIIWMLQVMSIGKLSGQVSEIHTGIWNFTTTKYLPASHAISPLK